MFVSIVVILYFSKYSIAISEDCQTAGYHGTCQRIRECPYAMHLLQHNGRPDICEFEGNDSIVCCLNYASRPVDRRPQRMSNQNPRLDNFNDAALNLRRFLEKVIPGLNSVNLPFGSNDNRLPIIFDDSEQPIWTVSRPNDFRTTSRPFQPSERPVSTDSNQLNNYPVTDVMPGDEKNDIPISQKKCLKYYPVPRFPSFVTGGTKSLPKQYPHMALIGFGDETDKEWLCGGSLISKKFVLTAAHCLYSNQYGKPRWIHLGDLDLSTDKDDASPQDFNIKRIISHPDFNPPQKYHDIALLELDKEPTFSAYVAPACLQTTKDINDTSMSATGWGKTAFAGDVTSFLMQVDLSAVGAEQCRKTYGSDGSYLPNGIIDEIQICAGGVKGKDTCGGDSGGPLQIKNLLRSSTIKVHTIVGITSFGKACGVGPTPGVYTRVSYYSKWIESIVWADDQD